jgi:hypothetical protein
VAGGSAYAPQAGEATDASAPSISSDGRYVSFTTAAALVHAANPGSNVYVRDMTLPPPAGAQCTAQEEQAEGGKRCAYELASARDGSTQGLTYERSTEGATASGRVALSADGREVAFVVRGASDLTSAEPGRTTTPPLQVAVRYLDPPQRTVLVSAEREASGQMSRRPVAGGAVTPSTQMGTRGGVGAPGAALSGDGSTVAWLGAHIPAQAPTLNGEGHQIEADDEKVSEAYDEPLWRRIAAGPGAPTRRMVGGGDPLAPGCPPGGTIEVPACRGPYPKLAWEGSRGGEESNYGWLGIGGYDGIPQLSYDGWTAALIGDPDSTSNVFVVNMREGLDRAQALRQLTREVPVANTVNPGFLPAYVAGAGDVHEVAISPDGQRIAFTTQRQQFPLAPPDYTETPPPRLGVQELYQIDLAREALVRVTHGPGGEASLEGNGSAPVTPNGAAAPSYASDGLTLAFADTASNLVFGDANGASDVFTVTQREDAAVPGPVLIGQAPAGQAPAAARWSLSVVPVLHRDGSATLYVVVPAAGELSATASATVPVAARASLRRARRARAHGAPSAGRRVELLSRTVAAARAASAAAGLLELPLRVYPRYAALLRTAAGVYATVRVGFRAAAGPPLLQTLALSLRRSARSSPPPRRRKRRPRRGGGA